MKKNFTMKFQNKNDEKKEKQKKYRFPKIE